VSFLREAIRGGVAVWRRRVGLQSAGTASQRASYLKSGSSTGVRIRGVANGQAHGVPDGHSSGRRALAKAKGGKKKLATSQSLIILILQSQNTYLTVAFKFYSKIAIILYFIMHISLINAFFVFLIHLYLCFRCIIKSFILNIGVCERSKTFTILRQREYQ
jgi:hypothetical protein